MSLFPNYEKNSQLFPTFSDRLNFLVFQVNWNHVRWHH